MTVFHVLHDYTVASLVGGAFAVGEHRPGWLGLRIMAAWLEKSSTPNAPARPVRWCGSTRRWCCWATPAIVAVAAVWWLAGAGWAIVLLIAAVIAGGAAVLRKR